MDKNKTKTGKKVIDSSARCITCDRACSMSGLCMKQWPEFTLRRPKGGKDDHADDEKNSKN
ncbi:MAG: hypothetical protein ABR886_09335 [Dehalococcoidales bacterium]